MRKKRPRAAMVLGAALLLAACSDATGPGRDPAGTYDLVTMNGAPLPYREDDIEILSMTFTLREDRTFSVESVQNWYLNGPDPLVLTPEGEGSYVFTEGSIQIFPDAAEGESIVAAYDGDAMTMQGDTEVGVYQRRAS